VPEAPEVALARIDTRLSGISDQLHRVDRDVAKIEQTADRAHDRIDSEIAAIRQHVQSELTTAMTEIRKEVGALTGWRNRMTGWAFGLAVGSGLVSGGLVTALAQLQP
jgi:hypothetical protein